MANTSTVATNVDTDQIKGITLSYKTVVGSEEFTTTMRVLGAKETTITAITTKAGMLEVLKIKEIADNGFIDNDQNLFFSAAQQRVLQEALYAVELQEVVATTSVSKKFLGLVGKKQRRDMLETMQYIFRLMDEQKYSYRGRVETTRSMFIPEIYDCIEAFKDPKDALFTAFKAGIDHLEGNELESLTTIVQTLSTRIMSLRSLKMHRLNIQTGKWEVMDLEDNARIRRVHDIATQLSHALMDSVAFITRKEDDTFRLTVTNGTMVIKGVEKPRLIKTVDCGLPSREVKRRNAKQGLILNPTDKTKVAQAAKVTRLVGRGGDDIQNVPVGKVKVKVVDGKKVVQTTTTEQLLKMGHNPKSAVKFHRNLEDWSEGSIYSLLRMTKDVLRAIRVTPRGKTKEEHTKEVIDRAKVDAHEIHNLIQDLKGKSFTMQIKRDLTGRLNVLFNRYSILGPQALGKHFYEDANKHIINAEGLMYIKHSIVVLSTENDPGVENRVSPVAAEVMFDIKPHYYIMKLLENEEIPKPSVPDIDAIESLAVQKAATILDPVKRTAFIEDAAKQVIELKIKVGEQFDDWTYDNGFKRFRENFYALALIKAYEDAITGTPSAFILARDLSTGGMGFFALEYGSLKMATYANILDGKSVLVTDKDELKKLLESGKISLSGEKLCKLTYTEEVAYNAYKVFASKLGYTNADGSLSYKEAKNILMPMLHGANYTSTARTMFEAGNNMNLTQKALATHIRQTLIDTFGFEFLNIGKINAWMKKFMLTPKCSHFTWKNRRGMECQSLNFEKSSEFDARTYHIDPKTREVKEVKVKITRAMPLRFEYVNNSWKILREEKDRDGKVTPFEISDTGFQANDEHSLDPEVIMSMIMDEDLELKLHIFDNFLAHPNEHAKITAHLIRVQKIIYRTSPMKDDLNQVIENSGLDIAQSDRLIYGGDIRKAGLANYIYYPKFKVDSDELCPILEKEFLAKIGVADMALQA